MDKVFTGTIQVELEKGVALEDAVKAAKSLLYATKAVRVVFVFNEVDVEVNTLLSSEDIMREYHSNFQIIA